MRLSTTHRLRLGYDTAKVDVSGEEISRHVSSGSGNPRARRMRPTTSSHAYRSTTWLRRGARGTTSLIRPN
jgi:hypothetical protein